MRKLAIGLGLAAGFAGMMAISSFEASAAQRCNAGRVWSSSLRSCMWKTGRVLIRHGCPYNLDKVCYRNKNGRLVNCRCQS